MLDQNIMIPYAEIAAFCERHHIVKLSFFGSVLRNDFHDDSDIDVLVEFDPAHIPGWAIVSMRDELSEILGREVDFLTPNGLDPYFRKKVLTLAQVIYERK